MRYAYQGRELFPVVEIYHDAIPYLSKVSVHDFFMDAKKCADAWRDGTAIIQDSFGDLLPMRKPSPGPLSYGHLVCLGAPLTLSEHAEPNVSPFAGSIVEAVGIMKERKDKAFEENALFQHYLDTSRYLRERFPDEDIPVFSGFGAQGPITTAVLMRGQDFFMDLYDEPALSREFLELITDSIIAFKKLSRRINGQPEMTASGGIADDFGALVPPSLWDDFVIPILCREYEACSEGAYRSLHMEGLMPAHLPLLSKLGLTHFQPSVSPALTLENVKANLDPAIPFDWLLYAYHVTEMTDAQIECWVKETIDAGVSIIRTQFGAYAYQFHKIDRIKAFLAAFEPFRVK